MESNSSTSSSSHEIRAIVLWSIAVVVSVFCIDRLGAWALTRVLLGTSSRQAELYGGGMKHDILAVGDSRGVNGFYTPKISSETGNSAFNISHNGMTPNIVDALVRDYIQFNAAPKLVVIETSCIAGTEIPESIAIYSPYLQFSSRFRVLFDEKISTKYHRFQVSHLHRMNSELFLRGLTYFKKSDQYWINHRTIDEAAIRRVEDGGPVELPLSVEGAKLIGRLASELEGKGILVKLVMSPYLPEYLDRITNLPDWIQKVEKYTGRNVFDYSNLQLTPDGFADSLHLNQTGGEMFLDKLIEDDVISTIRNSP